MFSDHSGIQLEINNRKTSGNFPNKYLETKYTLLNNLWSERNQNANKVF